MIKKSLKLSTIVISTTLSISALLGLSSMSKRTNLIAGTNKAHAMKTISEAKNLLTIKFKSEKIDGLTIAYREAGDPSKPKVLLLHGFPTSSHMFRNLIPHLAKDYHVIAPDYPGFGASSMPTIDKFDYTFDNISNVIGK